MRRDFHIAFALGRNQGGTRGSRPPGERFEIKAGHTTRKLVENYGFIYSCNFVLAKLLQNVANCISEALEFSIFVGCFQPPFLPPPPQENLAPGYAPAFALNLDLPEVSLNIKVCLIVIAFRIL